MLAGQGRSEHMRQPTAMGSHQIYNGVALEITAQRGNSLGLQSQDLSKHNAWTGRLHRIESQKLLPEQILRQPNAIG